MAATFPDGSQVVATDVSPAGPIVAVQTPNGVTQWHHPDDFTPEDHAMLGTGGSTGGGFAPGAPVVDPGKRSRRLGFEANDAWLAERSRCPG